MSGRRTTTGFEFASITNDANIEYIFTMQETRELLNHGRRAGKEEKIEIRVVSGEKNLILHILHKANVFTLLKYL